jgi:hypothetical protein
MHFQRQGYDLDRKLSSLEKSQIAAFCSLAENDLFDAQVDVSTYCKESHRFKIYTWWRVPSNYRATSKLYAYLLPLNARMAMVYNSGMDEWVQARLGSKYLVKTKSSSDSNIQENSDSNGNNAATAFDVKDHSVDTCIELFVNVF